MLEFQLIDGFSQASCGLELSLYTGILSQAEHWDYSKKDRKLVHLAQRKRG